MKLGLIRPSTTIGTLGIALALATAGCSSSDSKGALFAGDGGTNGNDGGTTTSTDPPHALGIVALGESHESGGTTSTPFVSASFIPDATTAASCTQSIAGCTVPMVATCDGKTGPLCGADEVCALDSSCTATCQTPCTVQCAVGEECYFVTPGSQACRTIEAFNAGALAFAGTTTPLTLYPPYTFEPTGSGSLFLAGAQLEVQGSGATGAGFAAFDQKFTATTFLQTSPSLSTLQASQVWGSGPIPVGWAPGNDSIVVTVSGPLGLAQCPATDSSGQFQVPRAVVNAVLGSGGQSITVSVTREHNDIDKNAKTQGTLTAETVQPIGFLEVSTSFNRVVLVRRVRRGRGHVRRRLRQFSRPPGPTAARVATPARLASTAPAAAATEPPPSAARSPAALTAARTSRRRTPTAARAGMRARAGRRARTSRARGGRRRRAPRARRRPRRGRARPTTRRARTTRTAPATPRASRAAPATRPATRTARSSTRRG